MLYQNEIEILESGIKTLGMTLTKKLKDKFKLEPMFTIIHHRFEVSEYEDGFDDLVYQVTDERQILSKIESDILAELRANIVAVKILYSKKLMISDGYKNPVVHMNALQEAGDDIPWGFAKRYGLSRGTVKALWLNTPAFQERFCRQRVADAKARGYARYGQKRYLKRRYELTEEEAEQFIEELWENPNVKSELFLEWFDRERLLQRLTESSRRNLMELMDKFGS